MRSSRFLENILDLDEIMKQQQNFERFGLKNQLKFESFESILIFA